MKQPTPLALVIELAARNRDALARQAATAQQLLSDARAQLVALGRYRDDYLARAARRPESDAATLINFNAFIVRLELAIGQQETTVAHQEARAAALQAEHVRAAVKVKSLEALAAVREAEARREQDRADRKLEDEHASRLARAASLKIAL